jgi:hypothetical protein
MQGLTGAYHYTREPIHQAYLKTLTSDLLPDSNRLWRVIARDMA